MGFDKVDVYLVGLFFAGVALGFLLNFVMGECRTCWSAGHVPVRCLIP